MGVEGEACVCVYVCGRWGFVGKQLTIKMGSYVIVTPSDRAKMCCFFSTCTVFLHKNIFFSLLIVIR